MKINLHITESCNFNCKYCFAHYEDKRRKPSQDDWLNIIGSCARSGLIDEINFAGGEPLLYKGLEELAVEARMCGLDTGVISNGQLMTDDWIKKNAKLFDTIGISMDSFVPDTTRRIGRYDPKFGTMTINRLAHRLGMLEEYAPNAKLKLNTVVSAYNKDEDMAGVLLSHSLPIDRWKLLMACSFDDGTHNNAEMLIKDYEFFAFVQRQLGHFGLKAAAADVARYIGDINGLDIEIIAEKAMKGSYIMIDANGWLIGNSSDNRYDYIADLKSESFADAFERLTLDETLYGARYGRGNPVLPKG